jgi:hypothetical protein
MTRHFLLAFEPRPLPGAKETDLDTVPPLRALPLVVALF